ncbi:MAG: AGE family epimerase/isomerase [Cyclobacteriaceae bacterium]|nr:AGE family epimerase/isomerase [Cyclobacteriaceae bacterium]MCH8516330.1 AGE family epimerase/isomerase [Cyclobacteriaceae bacterium]
MEKYSEIYRKELLENVVPFWEKYSVDTEYGGYFSCLNQDGKVYDTDKFVWLQARAVYMFSSLYDQVEARPKWKDIAQHGASFLEKHAIDAHGNFYFSLDRSGLPLVQPYNIFSDCFAAMGFGAYHKISGEEKYAEIAQNTFQNILKRAPNPKGIYNKLYPGTRDLKNFSLPMILSNLSIELDHLIEGEFAKSLHDQVIHEVMELFYDEGSGLILENINQDGTFNDSFEGRLFNPGHVLEAMWFIMDLAKLRNDEVLFDRATEIAYRAYEKGKDVTHGGVFYFKDILGYPPQQLEWSQKLWWVHLEAMVCMAKIVEHRGDEKAMGIFEELHNYCWRHFRDAPFGEWFGYLNRDGGVNLKLKGGKWKGFFHVPRALMKIMQSFEVVEKSKNVKKQNS